MYVVDTRVSLESTIHLEKKRGMSLNKLLVNTRALINFI